MANLIESLGYSLGKVHTGMIAYLCDLGREGNMGPITVFLQALGVDVPERPHAHREWKSVDLAIFDHRQPDVEVPRILIEMKVDDHENEEDPQTMRYADKFSCFQKFLFITLGTGEFFHKPYGEHFTWIRLKDFYAAVKPIAVLNKGIADWESALRSELDFRDEVRRNDRSALKQESVHAWNMYFLGFLKEKFEELDRANGGNIDPLCYSGRGTPDAILNFDKCEEGDYFEINRNGRLC